MADVRQQQMHIQIGGALIEITRKRRKRPLFNEIEFEIVIWFSRQSSTEIFALSALTSMQCITAHLRCTLFSFLWHFRSSLFFLGLLSAAQCLSMPISNYTFSIRIGIASFRAFEQYKHVRKYVARP